VLIGRRLADRLGILPGDEVTVLAPENLKASPLGDAIPATGYFEVTGTFVTGHFEYDSGHLYADLAAVVSLLDFEDDVGGLALAVEDPFLAREVGDSINSRLSFPYYTNDWMTLNNSLFSALKLEKLGMGLILSLIVLVAAFNIVSTLIMVVSDKTREIGILKSMGMTHGGVLRIFLLQGLAIGAIGTFLGTMGGLVLIWLQSRYELITLPGEVYGISTLPVALDVLDVGWIVGLSILIAFAATILPAQRASRLMPVEAIRHD
jgi:lipoprotein-releasing system permease protein